MCVSMNSAKIGVRATTDSLTPRRLSQISRPITRAMAQNLYGCQVIGRTLKTASTPDAIEIVIVNDGSKDDTAKVLEKYAGQVRPRDWA